MRFAARKGSIIRGRGSGNDRFGRPEFTRPSLEGGNRLSTEMLLSEREELMGQRK
jgi:hypothetical protein